MASEDNDTPHLPICPAPVPAGLDLHAPFHLSVVAAEARVAAALALLGELGDCINTTTSKLRPSKSEALIFKTP